MKGFGLMDAGVRVGKIWGIPIQLHASWFAIFGALTVAIGLARLPAAYPGLPLPTYFAIAVPTSLLVFVSVLLHELGHVWVAQRYSIHTRSITLFALGGVARMDYVPWSPAVQLRIAAAGPLVSMALAGLFYALGHATSPWPQLLQPVSWLAHVNLAMALFNSIPALPLDGGWILQAIVWQRQGSYHRGVQVALRNGSLLASGLVAVGIFMIMWSQSLDGLWLVIVGSFLLAVTSTDPLEFTLEKVLQDVPVKEVVQREIPQVAGWVPIQLLMKAKVFEESAYGVVVARDHTPQGLITVQHVGEITRSEWSHVPVAHAMTPFKQWLMVRPDEDLAAVWRRMNEMQATTAVVWEHDKFLGVITRDEIVDLAASFATSGEPNSVSSDGSGTGKAKDVL